MSDLVPPEEIDLRDPATAADHLRRCREQLAGLQSGEAMADFLEGEASRFEAVDSPLAEYLRTQRLRLGGGDEVRHAVRHGVPQTALLRQQVTERFRREEERRRAQVVAATEARGAAHVVALIAAALAGGGLWLVLWMAGLDNPWGGLVGGAGAVGIHALTRRAIRRALQAQVNLGP